MDHHLVSYNLELLRTSRRFFTMKALLHQSLIQFDGVDDVFPVDTGGRQVPGVLHLHPESRDQDQAVSIVDGDRHLRLPRE